MTHHEGTKTRRTENKVQGDEMATYILFFMITKNLRFIRGAAPAEPKSAAGERNRRFGTFREKGGKTVMTFIIQWKLDRRF
jgi:hypothetical protein